MNPSFFSAIYIAAACLVVAACASNRPTQSKFPFLVSAPLDDSQYFLEWEAIDVGNQSGAKNFILDRQQTLASLKQPQIDPYSGFDSTPEFCQADKIPSDSTGPSVGEGSLNSVAVNLFASPNRVLGLCVSANEVQKTQYQMLYCGGSSLYLIKYFYPATDAWLASPVAACRN